MGSNLAQRVVKRRPSRSESDLIWLLLVEQKEYKYHFVTCKSSVLSQFHSELHICQVLLKLEEEEKRRRDDVVD